MRAFVPLAIALLVAFAGCKSTDTPSDTPRTATPMPAKGAATLSQMIGAQGGGSTNRPAAEPVVLPTSGRVERVNLGQRFVVVDYTLGGMPALHSIVNVYRNDQKVGELRLSGPEKNGFVAADIVDGFIQVDDEVRVY